MTRSDWDLAPNTWWPVKEEVWKWRARGESYAAIQRHLGLEGVSTRRVSEGDDPSESSPPDRATIKLIVEMLPLMPDGLLATLPPEVQEHARVLRGEADTQRGLPTGAPPEADTHRSLRIHHGPVGDQTATAEAPGDGPPADGDTRPSLSLGEPKRYENEVLIRTYMGAHREGAFSLMERPARDTLWEYDPEQVVLYRIPVRNAGDHASAVVVKLQSVEPALDNGFPMPVLHLAGDNPPDHVSYARSHGFPLPTGDTQFVDLIAMSKTSPHGCYIWSVASRDAVEEHQLNGRYVLTIGALTAGDGPARRTYQLEVDARRGKLRIS